MNRARLLAMALLLAPVLGCASTAHRPQSVASTKILPDTIGLAEARAGVEEGYRRNREASLAKDIKAVMALRTEDFHTLTPDGKQHDRADMEAYTGGFLNGIDRWIELSFDIDSLSVHGDEADAITRQHAVRMQLRNDNKVHHVETWVTQRERWRRTPEGWKLAMVDQLRDQKRLVDGQPN